MRVFIVSDMEGGAGIPNWQQVDGGEELDEGCEFVVQKEWTEYTGALEDGCDAALFIGMHAMAGTSDGIMSHTVSGTQWHNVWFNDTVVGETGINAALCGTWGCPV